MNLNENQAIQLLVDRNIEMQYSLQLGKKLEFGLLGTP